MTGQTEQLDRVFKTSWFTKAAAKAHIGDPELCAAIRQVMLGQADDLGGGVYKKRIGKNMYRTIILAKVHQHWVYEYLFAKKDRENIDDKELVEFRQLARDYRKLSVIELKKLVREQRWMEICHDSKAEV